MAKGSKPTDSLEKLIKLKRWEEPPPGHLDYLTSRVIAQIEAEQAVSKRNLWTQLTELFEFKPLLACGYSAAAMALLLVGLQMNQGTPVKLKGAKTLPPTSANDAFRYATVSTEESNQVLQANSFQLPRSSGLWKPGDSPLRTGNHRSASSLVTPAGYQLAVPPVLYVPASRIQRTNSQPVR